MDTTQIHKTETNSFYIMSLDSKRKYIYRKGEFKKYFNELPEDIKAALKDYIHEKLGIKKEEEKIKVSFRIYAYGEEGQKFEKVKNQATLEKYNGTYCHIFRFADLTTKMNKNTYQTLITNYKADNTDRSKVVPIPRDDLINLTNRLFPKDHSFVQLLANIESILRYGKMTDLKLLETNENFDPLDAPLQKETTRKEKIMSRAIDYTGKTLQDMISSDEGSTFTKPYACVYTLLLELYSKDLKVGRNQKQEVMR